MLSAAELQGFLEGELRGMQPDGVSCRVEALEPLSARLHFDGRRAGPDGAWPTPAVMALADLALRAAIRAHTGEAAASATNLSFNFLRHAMEPGLVAECRLLKRGRRLVVGEVSICAEGAGEILCFATGTYALGSRAVPVGSRVVSR